MSSAQPSDSPVPDDSSRQSADKQPPKRRRRWRKSLIGLGVVLLLLLLLVALTPMLLGTGPVRSFIVGRLNDSIPGSISMGDLSLGWTSGIEVRDLKVYDEKNALILEVPSFSTDLTLLNAIRGKLTLGETKGDLNLTRVVVYEDGVSNVERAFGLDQPESPAEKKDKPRDEGPIRLPDITGDIAINILGGTIEMPGTLDEPMHLEPGSINATITDINQPIANSGKLAYRLGDASPGTIIFKGDIDVAEGNVLDVATLSGSEELSLANVNLAPIPGLIKQPRLNIAGITNGSLQLKGSESDATINGALKIADFAAGGEVLNGDVYRTSALNIPVQVTRTTADDISKLKIESLGVTSTDFTLDVSGNVPEGALQNLAAMKPPGNTGSVAIKLAVPGLANVVNQMPNTLKLAEGVTLQEGSLNTSAQIALKPEVATIGYDFSVQARGTRDGQPVALSLIQLNFDGNIVPQGEEKLPQVSDMTMALKSNFATVNGSANSLEAIAVNAGFDLAEMQKQLGQFVEFGELNLAGIGKLVLNTNGDVTDATTPIAVKLDFNVDNLTIRTSVADGGNIAIADEDVTGNLAANVTRPEAGGFTVNAQTLSLTSGSNLFAVTSVPDKDIVIVSPPEGDLQTTATLKLAADLKRLMDISQAFSATQPAAPAGDEPGQLTSALLDAVVTVAPEGGQTSVKLDGTIKDLSVTTATEPIQNETVKLAFEATTPEDFSTMLIDATVDSSFAKLIAQDTRVVLAEPASGGEPGATTMPSAFEMVQKATITADVPDVAKLYAIAGAFPSPEPEPATAPAAEGAEPPLPPMQITSGSATLKLDILREGDATKATLSDTRISDLAISRGEASYAFNQPIVVNANANVHAMESLDRLRVDELNADIGGIAKVTLAEPLEVTGFEKDVPTASGTIQVDGQIEPIMSLLEALQGTPDAYPYRGQLAITQRLGTGDADKLALKGQIRVTDFQTFSPGQSEPTFSEKEMTIADDLVIEPNAKSIMINALNVTMPASQALQVATTGSILDWEKQRELKNIKLDLTYDLEKLWPIIMPLLGPESQEKLKTLKITGKTQRTFIVSGSYPAVDSSGNELPFHEAIKSVVATGGLGVEVFDYEGVRIDKLEVPLSLRNGRLDTVYADRKGAARVPPPAQCNGGLLNVGALLVDLTRPDGPRLSTGENHELLKNVTINPLFADNILGKFVNPAFVNPDKAQGLISVTLVECRDLPLSDLIQQKVPANDGRADVRMSIIELAIGNEFLSKLVTTLKPNAFNNNALNGNIKNARIQIANGIVTENLAISIDEYALAFNGQVGLENQRLMPLNLHIPAPLLDKVGEDLLKYLPQGFDIPITGTTTAPRLDLGSITREIATAAAKAQLGNLLGRDDERKAPAPREGEKPTTKPAEKPTPEEQVIDVLEGLLKKR